MHFEDYIAGAASDSGYYVKVFCPKCKVEHMTTVSKIGWFGFRCARLQMFGTVPGWKDGGPAPEVPS